ncbi:hypothetical protein [Pseudoalteromonas sp. OOF1S-7]|uniref:hypothetical protein n=1 Tax=Pseudoalteromonas sp. OOF1S-7 TaxID=2917757 RepID=UPI001EF73128|nr:hypothetical protein [Pseudoalteromonas sp. OOF1S-7]MCG7534752.1 hypothetical protein [Pseudoalteromonas sp. OOF1S-7]
MKLNLKKKSIKSLSSDSKKLPNAATPAVAGGAHSDYVCETAQYCNSNDCYTKAWIDNCNPHHYTYQGTGCCETTLC